MSLATTSTESLAGEGGIMTTAEMAAYACDQIDQARTELRGLKIDDRDYPFSSVNWHKSV